MKIVGVDMMREIESRLDAGGISYDELMRRAGDALARQARMMVSNLDAPRILILVGKGNNGGDGLVAGRILAETLSDAVIQVYLLTARDDDLIATLKVSAETYGNVVIINAEEDKDKRVLRSAVVTADLVIDALFGIGVQLPLRDEAVKILRLVRAGLEDRRSARPEQNIINPATPRSEPSPAMAQVLAVDCPSGVDCDTGEVDSHTLKADVTITFIAVKQGLVAYPAGDFVGSLVLADCGIDGNHATMASVSDYLVDGAMVRSRLPKRPSDGHKGTFGRALLVCGSVNYVGAVALATEGAYRSGAGLVTVGTGRPTAQMLAGVHLEPTWLLLPHDMGVISADATPLLLENITGYEAMLLGCGLGTERATEDFVRSLLVGEGVTSKKRLGFQVEDDSSAQTQSVTLPPLLIDADGLNLLAKLAEWWTLLPEESIITPHVGEMARLANVDKGDVITERWSLVQDKAREWGVTIVLKGAHTIIATPEGRRYVLPFKVDGLATAGTGDVLAGLITGFRAQGLSAIDAALCGAYVHGLAGVLASEKYGGRSMLARDVVSMIGNALRAIERL